MKKIIIEIILWILAWIIALLLSYIIHRLDIIDNRLTSIEDKLNEPLTIDLQKY